MVETAALMVLMVLMQLPRAEALVVGKADLPMVIPEQQELVVVDS
jgi:hypothetical protein